MTTPGWYPDPTDPTQLRMWDGSAWTAQTMGTASPLPAGPPSSGRWHLPVVIASIAVTVVAALATVLVIATTTDEVPATAASTTEVVLEAAGEPGPDPFTTSVAAATPGVAPGGVEALTSQPGALQRVSASTPGLFGGTGNPALCDLDALELFLAGDANKAAAFAEAVGIKPDSIANWMSSLTPVLLREDTRVTNHGYQDQRANAYQAVLQAGTAVAVDAFGSPRIRCECGNPLAEPAAVAAEFTGTAWEQFDPDRLSIIGPAEAPVEVFTLTDVATGSPVTRPAGRLYEVSDTSIAGVPFGASEDVAMARLVAVLGSPTVTNRTTCFDDRFERVQHYWGSFGVRFELGQLDAWAAFEPSLINFPLGEIGGGVPQQLQFGPVAPGITLADVDVALSLAIARDPNSWIGQGPDSGVIFSNLNSVWTRAIGAKITRGAPAILIDHTGDSPDAQVQSVIAYGPFTPTGAPADAVCFGSDARF